MDLSTRRFGVVAACAAGLILALDGTPRAQTAQTTQTTPPPQQQVPVFRTATNFVQVDAYPTRDGHIVEGLSEKDFQVFEDGKAQAIESFEFIRSDTNTPEAMRHDPNSQAEGNLLAADPRNRVFIIYLDHFHATLAGSHSVIEPIVSTLNRMLTPGDLFGVATERMEPRQLLFGRQTTTIEDQLIKNWTWGLQSGANALEPEEEELVRCYGEAPALEITDRSREERTLESLGKFVRHLGALRESRKALIVFSIGWKLYKPDPGRLNTLLDLDHAATRPRVGITGNGQISIDQPPNPGMANWTKCGTEAARAFGLDNDRKYKDLIDLANRNNVSFYPINVNGLASGHEAETLRTLAENTDGLISNTNDFGLALRRVADDVSAYYLIGYSSTNAKFDGTYRKIDVKVTAPGARIKARRGYIAPYPDPPRSGPAAATKPEAPAGLSDALGALSRLRVSAEVYTYGVGGSADLGVVVELPWSAVSTAAWAKGADVTFTATGASPGAAGTPVTARIEAGQRSTLVRIPKPAGGAPFRVTVKLTGAGAVLSDRVDIAENVAAVVGEPLIYRATPAPQSPLRAAADYQFYYTERVHIEWPALGAIDRRVGRLLGKDGRALQVPVNLSERDQAGQPVLAADVNLAPLASGDYVIELVAAIGAQEVRRYVPIRVKR